VQRGNTLWFVYSGVFVSVALGFMYSAVSIAPISRNTAAAVDLGIPLILCDAWRIT